MSTTWTLLIADDCPEDREIYREYLSKDPHQSYQILEVASAEMGLQLCQKKHFDAVLLDFSLPDMTGLEFLDELKQQGVYNPLPVIMLTGQGDERVAVQAMKRGVQDYLVKQDLAPDILQSTVRGVIQQTLEQSHQDSDQVCLAQTSYPLDTARIALRIRQTLNLEQIIQTAVEEVHQLLRCDRVAVYQTIAQAKSGPSDSSLFSNRACEPELQKRCEAGLISGCEDPVQQFMAFLAAGDPSNSGKVQEATHLKPGEVSILTARNRKKMQESYLLAPLFLGHGLGNVPTHWGLLVACQPAHQRQWQSSEINCFSELAEHLAIAIHQAEQLEQAIAALENEKQLNTLKSQFVATVSHEYRTPLTAILAAASTLKLHADRLLQTRQQHFLQIIEDKARQMSQLVDDLLVLEAFEAGKTNLSLLPFELLQFVSDIIEEQRQVLTSRDNQGSSKPHELTFKISGNTRGVWGDQKLLRLVLVNLLENAIKYSPAGGVVEVHLIGTDSQIIFAVKDEGMGIPPADQTQLYQSFYRGSNVGAIPGTGLGLAIVKTCVDLYKGKITVESREGQGSIVTIYLPKQPA